MPAKKPFDLDALERQDTPAPFLFTAGGESFVITDIQERDWRDLASVGDDPREGMRAFLGDDYTRFEALPKGTMPGWKLTRLVDAVNTHFGVDTSGNGAGSSGS